MATVNNPSGGDSHIAMHEDITVPRVLARSSSDRTEGALIAVNIISLYEPEAMSKAFLIQYEAL